MAKFLRNIKNELTTDLKRQYAFPVRSGSGFLLTKYWEQQNKPLIKQVVSELHLTPDSKVLELGFGRGYGLDLCHSIIKKGRGRVFGIEASPYMISYAAKRFIIEITEEKSIALDSSPILHNMPYPNDFFDAIYHIDAFYFWGPKRMRETCQELFRILKPDGLLLCGMEFNKLRRFEKFGMLESDQYDPMKYMIHLEPAGFKNVKIDYQKIDDGDREIQIIRSQKPLHSEDDLDYESKMRKFETQVKQELAWQRLLKR